MLMEYEIVVIVWTCYVTLSGLLIDSRENCSTAKDPAGRGGFLMEQKTKLLFLVRYLNRRLRD